MKHGVKYVFYQIGKYSVKLSTDLNLSSFLPLYWEQYRQGFHQLPDVLLSLHQCDLNGFVAKQEGWQYIRKNNTVQLLYIKKKATPIFLLEYSVSLQQFSIYTHEISRHSVSLAMQHAILLALSSDCIGLHGVTVICGNKAIILSAPSGTGKTTLAKLLQRYCQTVIINGDFSLLSTDEAGKVYFEPTPFCGTSQKCLNYRLPISRIVFLTQSPHNEWQPLSAREAMVNLLSNMFIPEGDLIPRMSIHQSAMKIVDTIPMSVFSFAPNQQAAEMFHSIVTQ